LKIGHLERLQPLQNGRFRSKIKIAKNMREKHCTIGLELFCEKKRLTKTLNNPEMRRF